MFSLRFPDDGRVAHFCYEADRGGVPLADMLEKLRAYYAFIKRQQKHKGAFGLHPIRAVLIETPDESRARKLMELVEHAAVIGQGKHCTLFWFCISPLFTIPAADVPTASVERRYLEQPQIVLDRLWATPDLALHSVADAENLVA